MATARRAFSGSYESLALRCNGVRLSFKRSREVLSIGQSLLSVYPGPLPPAPPCSPPPPRSACPADGDHDESPRLPRGGRLTHAELEALERGVRGLHQRYRAAVRPITKGCLPTRQELKELRWHATAVSARCLVMCMDRVPKVRGKEGRERERERGENWCAEERAQQVTSYHMIRVKGTRDMQAGIWGHAAVIHPVCFFDYSK